jgi:uncharacterized protein YbaA (DUF1428 family)
MSIYNLVFRQILREGEGGAGGQGGGQGGQGGQGGGGNPPPAAAPWGEKPDAAWQIGDKPWYEVVLTDGPTKDFYREKKYANPAIAADANFSAQRMVTGNAVELPKDEADTKAWEAVNAKLRGDTVKAPTDYKFSMGKDGAGKDIPGDPAMITFGQQVAYDFGLSPKKAQSLVDRWNKFVGEQTQARTADEARKNEASINALKAKHGESFDAYVAGGRRVAASLGYSEQELLGIEKHIGAAPIIDLFARLGALSKEGGLVGGGSGGDPNNINNMDAAAAQAEIAKMRGDQPTQAILDNKDHPQHKEMVDRMQRLYAKAKTQQRA